MESYDAMVTNQKEEVVSLLIGACNRSVNHTDSQRRNLSRRLFDVSGQHNESQGKSRTEIESRRQLPDGTDVEPLSQLMNATKTSIETPTRQGLDVEVSKTHWVRISVRKQKQSVVPNTEAAEKNYFR